ncbi:MAG: EamA family transporter [Gammaproteobacteria bacterium]|nr:EamA family transporter [Gammaproteobacteria bacterium]
MNTTPVNNLRGIVFLVSAGLFLTTNDSITKWLVPHYPPGQILFIQAALITFIAALVMRIRGEAPLAVNSWRPHLYRGGLYAIGAFAFIISLRYLPFAEVVAIAFAGPMFMTLFGRFFLGESVGRHRLGAVLVGFIGVLFVIRPGTNAMHWAVVLPLIVALADAARDLVTRKMAGGESNLRIVFSTGGILTLAGLLTVIGGWQALRLEDLMWFSISASTFVIAHCLMVEAFRHGQLVAVAPFRYVQIIWTIIAGLVFWGEVPTPMVFVGIGTICASGIYIAWREAIVNRTKK